MANGLNEVTTNRLRQFIQSEKFQQLPKNTQDRLTNFVSRADEPLIESTEPTLGGRGVIPESPVGPIGQFRLGLATPIGRDVLLRKQFGEVLGAPGSEVVPTERGLQAVDPSGFDTSDIPEAAAETAPFAGQVIGSIGGGILGGAIGRPIVGSAVGAGVLTGVGEFTKRAVGKAVGARPDETFVQALSGSLEEASKAGLIDLTFGGVGAAFPAIGKTIGRVAGKAGEFARKLGQVKKSTVSKFKQLVKENRINEAFQPEKLEPEFGSRTLIPRLQEGVTKLIGEFSDNTQKLLAKFNVTDDTVSALKNKGLENIKNTQTKLGNSTAELSERIQLSLSKNLDDAGNVFDEVLRGQPEGTRISSKEFVNGLRRIFKNEGIMNTDNSFRIIDQANVPRQLKLLRRIHDEVVSGTIAPGKVRATGTIPIEDYFRFKGLIGDSVTGGRLDRVLFEANRNLTDGAVNSVEGLGAANQIYSRAKTFHDDFIAESKTGEKVLERFVKLTKKQKGELTRLDKEIPFLDDLNSLISAREIDDLVNKEFSQQKLEGLFSQGISETKTFARDNLKNIDELLPQEAKFFDDYEQWIAQLDLQNANVFASRGGLIKPVAEAGVSRFFRNVLPAAQRVGRFRAAAEQATRPVRTGVRRLGPAITREKINEE